MSVPWAATTFLKRRKESARKFNPDCTVNNQRHPTKTMATEDLKDIEEELVDYEEEEDGNTENKEEESKEAAKYV